MTAKHKLGLLVIASLVLSSCGSSDSPRMACIDYALEVVEESSPALIDRNHPGSAGNKRGYEERVAETMMAPKRYMHGTVIEITKNEAGRLLIL